MSGSSLTAVAAFLLSGLLSSVASKEDQTCDPSSESCVAEGGGDRTCADEVACSEGAAAAKPKGCADTNSNCVMWAGMGECKANPGFMIVECAHSCHTCHLRDPKVRCVRNPSEQPALRGADHGDGIKAVMEWATSEAWASYSPTVLSRDPWVVQYEDFLSDDEVQGLLEALRSR